MKFATLAIQALTLTGLSSFGSAKSPLRGSRFEGQEEASVSKEEHLMELAKAVTVLQDAGIDVNNLDWGKKPEPEEQLVGTSMSVGLAGVDMSKLSPTEEMFLEDAIQFSFNQVNKGADMSVNAARIVSKGTPIDNNSNSNPPSLGRQSSTWYYWPGVTTDFRCRMCRPDRFLGASNVDSSSPMVAAWEDKLAKVLKTSGWDAFAEVTDADIHLSADITDVFAAATATAMNSVLTEA